MGCFDEIAGITDRDDVDGEFIDFITVSISYYKIERQVHSCVSSKKCIMRRLGCGEMENLQDKF